MIVYIFLIVLIFLIFCFLLVRYFSCILFMYLSSALSLLIDFDYFFFKKKNLKRTYLQVVDQ
jgi:hypothetical protein